MKDIYNISLLIALLSLSGCGKPEPGPSSGTIIGFISLLDLDSVWLYDKSGVEAFVEHSTDSVYTDSTGKYKFTDIASGPVNIIFRKNGYGTTKLSGIDNPGGYFPVVPPTMTLYQVPDIKVSNINISNNDEFINVSGTIPPTNKYDLETFISDSPDVSTIDFKYYSLDSLRATDPTTNFTKHFYFGIGGFTRFPFQSGQTIYILFYFKNIYERVGIYDPDIDLTYYTSHEQSANMIVYTIQ